MRSPSKANLIALVSSILFLGAILFIVSRQSSFAAIVDVWNRTDAFAFALAVLIMVFVPAASAWRVRVITEVDGLPDISFLSLFRIQLIAQFVSHGAPISALADLAKAAMMKLRFSLPAGRSIRLVFYERICGALGSVVVGLLTAIVQLFVPTPFKLVVAQLILWAAGCAAVAVLLAIGGLHVNTGITLLDRVVRAVTGLGHMLRHGWVAGELVLAAFVQSLGFAAVFIVLAYGMHLQVSRLHIVLFMPLIFFVSSLPIFYQGWGGREVVVIATIGGLGQITSTESIALSVAFGVVVFLASLPGAAFWIMRPSMRKAVRLEVEQAPQA